MTLGFGYGQKIERNRLQVTSGEIFKRMQKYKDLMTQLSKVNKYGIYLLFIFLMAKIINKCGKKDRTLVLRKQIGHISLKRFSLDENTKNITLKISS